MKDFVAKSWDDKLKNKFHGIKKILESTHLILRAVQNGQDKVQPESEGFCSKVLG